MEKTVKQVVRSPGLKLAMICFIKLVLPVPDSADNQNSLLWCEIFGDRTIMCGANVPMTKANCLTGTRSDSCRFVIVG